jgi:hypothetical protein
MLFRTGRTGSQWTLKNKSRYGIKYKGEDMKRIIIITILSIFILGCSWGKINESYQILPQESTSKSQGLNEEYRYNGGNWQRCPINTDYQSYIYQNGQWIKIENKGDK